MSEGKRITIYLPHGVHKEMRDTAWRLRKSLSGYLVDLHRKEMDLVEAKKDLSNGPREMVAFTTEPPKKSDPAGAKQDIIDTLKEKVAKIPGKKSDPYFRPMEKKGSKKGGKK